MTELNDKYFVVRYRNNSPYELPWIESNPIYHKWEAKRMAIERRKMGWHQVEMLTIRDYSID
jgi:hypothetical protein